MSGKRYGPSFYVSSVRLFCKSHKTPFMGGSVNFKRMFVFNFDEWRV